MLGIQPLGRLFAIAVGTAAVSAAGFVLTAADIGDKLGGPNRRYWALTWFLVFVVALVIMFSKLAQRIHALEERAKSKFEASDDVSTHSDPGVTFKHRQIEVRNSGLDSITNVQVLLVGIEPKQPSIRFPQVMRPHETGQMDSDYSFTLNNNVPKPIGICGINMATPDQLKIFMMSVPLNHEPTIRAPQHGEVYRFLLKISGHGMETVERDLLVSMKPGHELFTEFARR